MGKITFKEFLNEISNRRAAGEMTQPQQQRRENATKTDRQRKQEVEQEIKDLESSNDPDKKQLARQMKQTATLRQRIEKKEQNNQQPQGTQNST